MSNHIQKLKAFMLTFLMVATTLTADAQWVETTAALNTRAQPQGRKMGVLPQGTQIELIRREGNWSLIQTSTGRRAYVFNKYLRQVPEASATSACLGCLRPEPRPEDLKTEEIQDVLDLVNPEPPESFSACISERLVKEAKSRSISVYGGRLKGRGRCAYAVRKSLNQAGIWQGGGIGHAKDMVPGLRTMGFKNILSRGMTPDNAPNGSILVYGTPLKGARCKGLGNIYGHVEIKESNKSFIYDGNPKFHIQKALGPRCRPLIGVMVMGSSCPNCTTATKRTCGV